MPRMALEVLYDDVTERFRKERTECELAFGRRAITEHPIAADIRRVVFVPGDRNGAAGSLEPPKYAGGAPRVLATFREVFHVVITAQDPSNPTDERLQYRAVSLLFDAWERACQCSMKAAFSVTAIDWDADRPQNTFGAAVRVTCQLLRPILDDAFDTTTAPIKKIEVALTELDQTTDFVVPTVA